LVQRLLHLHATSIRHVIVDAYENVPNADGDTAAFNQILRACAACNNLESLEIDLEHQWTLIVDDDVQVYLADAVRSRCLSLNSLCVNGGIGHVRDSGGGFRWAFAPLPPSVRNLRLVATQHDIDIAWDDTVTTEPEKCVATLLALRGNATLRSLTLKDYAATLADEATRVDLDGGARVGVLATTKLQRLVLTSTSFNDAGIDAVLQHLPPSLEELSIEETTRCLADWLPHFNELVSVLAAGRCRNLRKLELLEEDPYNADPTSSIQSIIHETLVQFSSLVSPSDLMPCLASLRLALPAVSDEHGDTFDASVLVEPAAELARQLGGNAVLRDFALSGLPVQAIRVFADALRRNSALHTLGLAFRCFELQDLAFAVDGLTTLVAAMSQNNALRHVILRMDVRSPRFTYSSPEPTLSEALQSAQRALEAHPTCVFDDVAYGRYCA